MSGKPEKLPQLDLERAIRKRARSSKHDEFLIAQLEQRRRLPVGFGHELSEVA